MFGQTALNSAPADGFGSFIDKVSIFGACPAINLQHQDSRFFSAIAIDDKVSAAPTISNCMIFGNQVGILVSASVDGAIRHDGTTLMNNTIAWNRVGLWNGQLFVQNPQVSAGISKLILINNIFDGSASITAVGARNWTMFVTQSTTCFEGVGLEDLAICMDPSSPVYSRVEEFGISQFV